MKIAELNVGQGDIVVAGTVKELDELKIINKYGRELKLRNVVIEDDSGSIKLTLWNEDAEKFAVGDTVKVINGYVNEFNGEKQLTAGKQGKIEKAGEGVPEVASDSSTTMEEAEVAEGLEHTSGPTASEAEFADKSGAEPSDQPVQEPPSE